MSLEDVLFLPLKSSGALHATVSATDRPPAATADVIVFERFFASDIPKSQIRTELSAARSTFPAFMSPCTMSTSRMCRYAIPVAVSVASRALSRASRTLSGSYRYSSSAPPGHSSMTMYPNFVTTPNTRRMFGWFRLHMIIASFRMSFAAYVGTRFESPSNIALTATFSPAYLAKYTVPYPPVPRTSSRSRSTSEGSISGVKSRRRGSFCFAMYFSMSSTRVSSSGTRQFANHTHPHLSSIRRSAGLYQIARIMHMTTGIVIPSPPTT